MKQMRFTYIYAIMRSRFLKLFKKFSKKLRPCKNAQMQNETLLKLNYTVSISIFFLYSPVIERSTRITELFLLKLQLIFMIPTLEPSPIKDRLAILVPIRVSVSI